MNDTQRVIAANLRQLRSLHRLSQEEVAERIGVTRQAVAKWENGDSLPDVINCENLADLYGVSINDLIRYDAEKTGLPIGPKDKHIFGTVAIGERGQIVLPKKARDTLGLKAGDTLVVLGDSSPLMPGIALINAQQFLRMTGASLDALLSGGQ
ncbi:MAG: helix-turn-helix domain-containing protein [Oscillospiraceae bacterium]|jgi:AbrB family looped-hinge helix DNA binding protein|nr:helix-turn-helix domain-containing protein [Oscillospiraceae bacterium]